jgi:nitrogen fixation/metabolism regulation signal transduction histidine kinase
VDPPEAGRPRPSRLSLRTRLTLAFIGISVIPGILLTAVAVNEVNRAIDLIQNPGVDRTLQSAVEATRASLSRVEADLRREVEEVSLSAPLRRAIEAEDFDAVADLLEGETGHRPLDFFVLLGGGESGWREASRAPVEELAPIDSLVGPPDEVAETLLQTGIAHAPSGSLVAAVPVPVLPEGEDRWLLLGGRRLGRGFYARLDSMAVGLELYHQLGLYKAVSMRGTWLGIGAFFLLLTLLSIWFARRFASDVSGPVVELSAAMREVARGEAPPRIEPRGSPEVRELIESFQRMTRDLAEARVTLARAERLAAWQEVARRVAHEIRNPLTPIQLSIHRLRKAAEHVAPGEREEMERSLTAIHDEVESLKRIAGSFSELARLPEPTLERTDLGEALESMVSLHGEGAPAVTLDAAHEPERFLTDRTLLREAVTNLLKNAREAAGPEGRVTVRTEPAILPGGAVSVRIIFEDTGPGIASGLREKILEPYYTTKPAGTGLGLAIVNRVALLLGGRIEVGDAPGGGASIALVLPADPGAGDGIRG